MNKVVIVVRNGLIENVYDQENNIEVSIYDLDEQDDPERLDQQISERDKEIKDMYQIY